MRGTDAIALVLFAAAAVLFGARLLDVDVDADWPFLLIALGLAFRSLPGSFGLTR